MSRTLVGLSLLSLLALLALLLAPSVARADLCFFDSKQDGTGATVRWTAPPIQYTINASRLPAAQQAAAIAAVQAAFSAWELPCTTLKFQYAGPSTSTTDVAGAILVYWGNDAASWTHGLSAYFYSLEFATTAGDVSKSVIGMNAKDYSWSVGAQPSQIDIQTAVTQMIPGAIGFYVGATPQTGSLPIQYNDVNTTLTQEHKDGARYVYFKADPGCVQPAKPKACATWTPPPPDGGPTPADGGAKDKGLSKEAGLAKDGGTAKEGGAGRDGGSKDGLKKDGGARDGVKKDSVSSKEQGAVADGVASRDKARADGAIDRRASDGRGEVHGDRGATVDRRTIDISGVPGAEARPGADLRLPAGGNSGGCGCGVGDAGHTGRTRFPTTLLLLVILVVVARRRSCCY